MATNLPFQMHPAQLQVYQNPAPRKVVQAGRGWGKTRFAAIDATVKALEDENWCGRALTREAEIMYMAPTFDQAKGIFWPIILEVTDPVREGKNENEGVITLVNGARIRIRGMDKAAAERSRGFILRHAILDEFADMEPQAWDVITAPSVMKTNGTALFIGTPKRGREHFPQILHYAQEAPVDPRYGFPLWAGFTFTSYDNPWLDEQAIEAMTATMTEEQKRQEIMAENLSAGGNYLRPEWWRFDTREPYDGYYVIAVDLAGFTTSMEDRRTKERRDDTAIAVVKITSRGWWVKEIQYGRWDYRETALRIVRAAAKVDAIRVGIEKGTAFQAIWPTVVELMAQYGRFGGRRGEPLSHGNEKKEVRVMGAVEGRLQRGRIILNCNPELLDHERPEWVRELIHQAAQFPAPNTRDDLIDALSYTAQLGTATFTEYDPARHDSWQPVDDIAGI